MDLSGQRESGNVEDRRGKGVVMAGGGIGAVVIGLIMYFVFGVNPQGLMQQGGPQQAGPAGDPNDPQYIFVKKVLGSTEQVWNDRFKQKPVNWPRNWPQRYKEPKLVVFRDRVESACGVQSAAVGPFYCPGDEQVYIDLTFFDVMESRLKAGGEFARAYVIAHEVGHHMQRMLGYSAEPGNNESSVRLELQADYLAGVWAHDARDALKLNSRDLESAVNAAYQIGDDTLMKRSGARPREAAFTHGSSEQRVNAFRAGFETGKFDKSALDYFFTTPYERLAK